MWFHGYSLEVGLSVWWTWGIQHTFGGAIYCEVTFERLAHNMVQTGMRYGMMLFITSEVMFFVL